MRNDISAAVDAALAEVAAASSSSALASLAGSLAGKKSPLGQLKSKLGSVADIEERKSIGQALNEALLTVEAAVATKRAECENAEIEAQMASEGLDLTERIASSRRGRTHLVTQATQRLEDVFVGLGFQIAEGPEVESDFYNFEALNIPAAHPARGMWDTLYVDLGDPETVLLRTHTSPVQIRVMTDGEPPIYAVMPGRVYRRDTADASHMPVFHQIEGLAVDRGITMAHLKGTLDHLASAMFGEGITTRLRPSYFPFTEPSAELDLQCFVCRGASVGNPEAPCRTCSSEGWIDWGGCGMVNPRVLRAAGIDTDRYSGFAFGMGVERTLMFRHGVTDIRDMVEGDARFSRAFGVEV